ncbi:MAG: hypothetical protein PHI96_05645 [Desulfovibrio sp.]|nr:hypothetical protein [Desulfovibrio sp.]
MINNNENILPANVWPDTDSAHSAVIDLIDACNLRCPECVRGSRTMKNSSGKMELCLFKDICSKLVKEKINKVYLYNWTEPFLNKDIAAFIGAAKSFGLKTTVSSNFSLNDIPILEAFEAGLDELVVSVSGFSSKIQQIYHRGSNIETIKNNLLLVATNKEYLDKTKVKYLLFNYNQGELGLMRQFAESLGMGFFIANACGDPLNCKLEGKTSVTFKEKSSIIIDEAGKVEYIKYDAQSCSAKANHICQVGISPTIDYRGNAYLCCDRPNLEVFNLGSYLEMSVEEMLLKKYLHPECKNCTSTRFCKLSTAQEEAMMRSLFKPAV